MAPRTNRSIVKEMQKDMKEIYFATCRLHCFMDKPGTKANLAYIENIVEKYRTEDWET